MEEATCKWFPASNSSREVRPPHIGICTPLDPAKCEPNYCTGSSGERILPTNYIHGMFRLPSSGARPAARGVHGIGRGGALRPGFSGPGRRARNRRVALRDSGRRRLHCAARGALFASCFPCSRSLQSPPVSACAQFQADRAQAQQSKALHPFDSSLNATTPARVPLWTGPNRRGKTAGCMQSLTLWSHLAGD